MARSARLSWLVLVVPFALVGCSRAEVAGPAGTGAEALGTPVGFSVAPAYDIGQPPPPNHLVVFRRRAVPASFADDVAALGGSVVLTIPQVGAASVSGLDEDGAAALGARRDVVTVELEERIELDLPSSGQVASAGGAVSGAGGGVASHVDPTLAFFFPRQWHHRAIGADAAWAAGEHGSAGVTVAILDTGIDYTNIDLAGLVDLSRSASFVPFDDAIVDAVFPGRHHISDLHFHGTHVASTVASNAFVVAGVTSHTTLIGVKVCDVFGDCPTLGVLAGIIHAATNGADIINMSLGGGFTKSTLPGFVSLLNRVFNFARQRGSLIVVSAGNAGSDLDHNGNVYSTYCDTPAVACVSATGPTNAPTTGGPFDNVDTPTGYTNYGRSAINVAAPGGNSAAGAGGWVWQACSQTSLQVPICQTGLFTLGVTGTSMASPHAAGVAAILAQSGKRGTALRSALQRTADDLGQPGTDPFFGKGRVNAATAAGAN